MVNYIGLDGEMSGTEIEFGARLIQIGFAFEDGAHYNAFLNPGKMSWSYEAQEVHGITQDRVNDFMSATEIDQRAYEFLTGRGLDPKRRAQAIPVGWNVGSFDMPFVKKSMPKTYGLFSRRVVDLNSLCFALDGRKDNGMPVKFETWKRRSKDYAINRIGYEDAHDAGWDARMSLYCFYYLRDVMNAIA